MKSIFRILSAWLFIHAAVIFAQDTAAAPAQVQAPAKQTVYRQVVDELSRIPHRLPGTPEYYKAIDGLEKILKENGIDVKRQVFQTYVPEVTKNIFRVNGKDVPIYPLAPNEIALTTTGEHVIEGKTIYLTKKELDSKYTNIEGRVVFLEWGEYDYVKILLTEGAKAIVFVGNDKATQWEVAKNIGQYPAQYPFFYIYRDEAEKAGLLKKDTADSKPSEVVLSVNTSWKAVEGINLWAEIKSADPKVFQLNQPEAVVLGARMDTFGMVPGQIRGDRLTANLGLLAQTAADLAKQELPRSVFLIFYGASFNSYDGLRHFYYPVSIRNNRKEPTVQTYGAGFRQELANTEELLKTLETNPVVKDEDNVQFRVRMLLRDAIVATDSRLNYELAENNLLTSRKKERLAGKEGEVTAEQKAALEKEIKKLESDHEGLVAYKVKVSNLRKFINERVIPENLQDFMKSEFVEKIQETLNLRISELETDIRMADSWEEIAAATKPYAFIGAFFYDFSAADRPFALVTRSYEAVYSNKEMSSSVYTKFFSTLKKHIDDLDMQKSSAYLLPESLDPQTFSDSMTGLSLTNLPSAVGLSMKLAGFTMRNLGNGYDFDELPGKYDFQLEKLVPGINEFVGHIIKGEQYSMYSQLPDSVTMEKFINYYYKNGSYYGKKFVLLGPDGKEIAGPAAGAFAYNGHHQYSRILPMAGFTSSAFGRVNGAGYVTMPLLTQNTNNATLNKLCGAMLFDQFGRTIYIHTMTAPEKLFRCYGGAMVYNYAPLTSNFASPLSFLNGKNDGKFTNTQAYERVATGDGYSYIDRDVKAKIYFFEETFMLGSSAENPGGEGVPFTPEFLMNINPSRMSIESTILLNLQRLDKIHERNIFNSIIEGYHDRAEQHLLEAKKAREDGDINLARAHELFGQTVGIRAYRPLKTMIDDLVKSVLILMLLTIPFAFAMERLLIGATNIYKQMGWILVFFTGTFLLLFFTHPAFALSQAPLIIFIAFIIIVLSLIVIYIVMNRFKSELMVLQGLDTSAHRVNSENSVVLAAIMIGVSSMRNRPTKTFLTILTVVLLTFTIISFASFDSTGSVRPTYFGDSSGEVRIESFLPNHVDMLQTTLKGVRDMYSKDYDVYERSASYQNPFYMQPTYPNQQNTICNLKSSKDKLLKLEAVIGFEPGEVTRSQKLAELMPKINLEETRNNPVPGVYLSRNTAELLDLKVGDEFLLRTMTVRLDGIFDAAQLDSFTYLDNAKATPPNFEATAKAENKNIGQVAHGGTEDTSNYVWSSPDVTMLTDFETAKKVNGFRNAIILYPKEGHHPDLITDATRIAEISFGIVYSNTANGIYKHFFTEAFTASGLSNLFVPLLLGALIILSSLLGSIADREREIYTFSALGLSPKDVSVLFFAESGVYAVIGGLGGYLLSQITTAVLNWLSRLGLLEAPEMNYSSMTTVYTILIVMGIVFLSTIYPAIKAGKAANPDVARKWKMPPPEGDKLVFQFPFTVSSVDFGGILIFISEHFKNHADSSLGSFAASNVRITRGETGGVLSADLTLAPFDLGVAEEFNMYSAPSDIEGIDVITVSITRLDGSKGAWLRGNRRFVDEIRNQFLLWRSLPVDTVMHYRGLAAESLKNDDVQA